MKIEKTKNVLRITSDQYEIYAEITPYNEVYIEGLDGSSIPLSITYIMIDWIQENTRRPKKKYKISYVMDECPPALSLPSGTIIEEVYA